MYQLEHKIKRDMEDKYPWIAKKNLGVFLCFGRDWFKAHQKGLLFLLNAPLIKYWFRWVLRIHKDVPANKTIINIEPHCYAWANGDGTTTWDFRTHTKFSKRIYLAFRPMWWALHFFDILFANNFMPEFNLGYDVLTYYPDAHTESSTCDGTVWRSASQSTFAGLVAGAGTTATDNAGGLCPEVYSDSISGRWQKIDRAFVFFNTASIPDDATVSTAVLSLRGISVYNGLPDVSSFNIYGTTSTSTTSLSTLDYAKVNTTAQSDTAISESTFVAYKYNNFTLNAAGLGNISKIGLSRFSIRIVADAANSAPTWKASDADYFYMQDAEYEGTIEDPKLVILTSPTILIDSYEGDNSLDTNLYSGGKEGVAQSFTGKDAKITNCRFILQKVGSPTGNAYAKLYSHSGTYGTSSIPGSLLATSDALTVSGITTTLLAQTLSFSGAQQYVMSNGSHYVITIEYTGGNGTNYIVVYSNASSPTHSGNYADTADLISWSENNSLDVNFSVWGEAVSPSTFVPQMIMVG